jgi:predicted nucleic acid-binding protein
MKVLLDTSAWYGFVSKDDQFHTRAVNYLKKDPFLLIPYPVLEELTAILHHRKGKRNTIIALQELRISNISKIIYLNEKEDKEIWKLYTSLTSKIDYVDASIIWLARKLTIPVFTFDKHFKNIGLKLVP